MPFLLLSVAPLLPRVLLVPDRPRAARVRAYAPPPAPVDAPPPTHAPASPTAPERTDHAAFCEIAEAHAHTWPEIRRLPGPLYLAADRPRGIQITADNLSAFAAALDAYSGRRNHAVRPYLLAGLPPAPAPTPAPAQAPR